VLIGAAISALAALPLALPFQASVHDLGLLALLGVVQLAIPCLIAVQAARVLSAPEVALLALLEVIFGVLWAWLGANEAPPAAVLGGGALVLCALIANEALGLKGTGVRN
jgi:drug/metabolite transporter (DMT)-like permease